MDRSDYEVLEEKNFLMKSGEISPGNPVLTVDLMSRSTIEYSEKLLIERNIQDYELRPGFVALGLGSAAMAFYVANSNLFRGSITSPKSLTINALGAVLAVSGFLNMKPVGEPRPTGEERYLRSTGSTTVIDTVRASANPDSRASISVKYDNEIVFEENRRFDNGRLEIALGNQLSNQSIKGENPRDVTIDIAFEDSSYHYIYDVDQILKPYAQVTSQLTALRSNPSLASDNVLADLLKGSQVQIKNASNTNWYQVLYGISENYIRKKDAEIIWRSADFSQENQVVTVPRVPFGNIDVESNIPILRGLSPNAAALIITNQNYSGSLAERNYAHRDGKLIQSYLSTAFGYMDENIYELQDITDAEQINQVISDLRSFSNDSTELFIYISGYGAHKHNAGISTLSLKTVGEEEAQGENVDLYKLFEQLSSLRSDQTIIFGDIDFSNAVFAQQSTVNYRRRILEEHTAPVSQNPRASLIMGNRLNQPSGLYVSSDGEDNKHHIFPYFIVKAIQQRRTTISAIYQFLERNVTYTSRRLHDRPQAPLLIGNTMLDLVNN